jgi:CubicO group peptidase (beta-lactamase class C family)
MMKKPRRLLSLVLFLSAAAYAQDSSEAAGYFPGESWRTSSAERQGMDPRMLEEMRKAYGGKARILIVRNGYLIGGQDQADLKTEVQHVHSCTKSVISLLYGMVFPGGRVDERLVGYFPLYRRADNAGVRISHLLSMTSGMQWSDMPNIDSARLPAEKDWVAYIMKKKIVKEPGSAWNYNSGGSQLLSAIMQKEIGRPLRAYAQERLFGPLGIESPTWWESNDGCLTAGWGLHLSLYDLAKIGYLVLRGGRWADTRVVDEAWIDESTKPRIKVDKDYSYGYQWWIYDALRYKAFKAYGKLGNHGVALIIAPELDLEIVIAGEAVDDIGILERFVFPSVRKEGVRGGERP